MVSVKGPKSALTDFIEKHGIKINNKITEVEKKPILQKKKTVKKTYKKSKPFELIRKDCQTQSLQNILIEKILLNLENFKLSDDHLEMISKFLSVQRRQNKKFYNFLIENCKEKLVIYDCSNICEDEFIFVNYLIKDLECHQCGQMTNYKISEILNLHKNLRILKITGAYLITEICLPKNLIILDLSNCNRLGNSIILELNEKYKKLEELKLSYCYKITDQIQLKTKVKRLFVEETRISEDFYNEKFLTFLSLKNCPNIDNLKKDYANLEYLNIENITTVENVNISTRLKYLNIKRCYKLNSWIIENKLKLVNLEYLNISYLEIDNFEFLFDFVNLKELDLSWCCNVTDDLLITLIKQTKIQKISVFGCFNLTSKSAQFSYENKNKLLVVGNHAETKFLIQNV